MNKNKKSKTLLSLYEWVETFLVALCCVVLLFTFAVKFVTVSGSSMEQTLHNADRLLITDMFYQPKNGDIVVVDVSGNLKLEREHGISSSAPYIKRVIATEGQTIDIDPESWTVYVDGEAIDEPYVYHCNSSDMYLDPFERITYPFTVSEDCVFVMGDNRNGSSDSRMIGEIHENYILGRVILRLFPFGGVE
ncbi:MAG: signal peptidase I [Clostridia bacterium]|nr:signal peptidase I [Clostridia bacterium]